MPKEIDKFNVSYSFFSPLSHLIVSSRMNENNPQHYINAQFILYIRVGK